MDLQKDGGDRSIQRTFMRLTHLYFTKTFKQLSQTEIHPGQLPMLKLLGEGDGLSQREISTKLHIKPPTVAVSMKRLEKGGVVFRKPDEKDQRISRVYLSEEGKRLYRNLEELIKRNEELLFQGFSESEICLFQRLLEQMIQNLEKMPTDVGDKIRKESKQC